MLYVMELPDGIKPLDMLYADTDDAFAMLLSAVPVGQVATPVDYVFTKDNKKGFHNPTLFVVDKPTEGSHE